MAQGIAYYFKEQVSNSYSNCWTHSFSSQSNANERNQNPFGSVLDSPDSSLGDMNPFGNESASTVQKPTIKGNKIINNNPFITQSSKSTTEDYSGTNNPFEERNADAVQGNNPFGEVSSEENCWGFEIIDISALWACGDAMVSKLCGKLEMGY